MKYIFLPGNSFKNRKWINRLATEFNPPKEVIHYNHWEREEKDINFEEELKKLKTLDIGECRVIAKSIGSILSLKAIRKGILNPEKCYFIGFPLYYVDKNNVDLQKLLNIEIPITFIQKPQDYQASFKQLKEVMSEIKDKNSNFIEYHQDDEPDDNHHYNNTAYLKQIIISA
jgi:hypothetical protein